jgi:hypothetical protein
MERKRIAQQKSRAFMIKSTEFKQNLQRVIEDGMKILEEWIRNEDERILSSEGWKRRNSQMEWQPEMTVTIPETVRIHYPWDVVRDLEMESFKKGGGKLGKEWTGREDRWGGILNKNDSTTNACLHWDEETRH